MKSAGTSRPSGRSSLAVSTATRELQPVAAEGTGFLRHSRLDAWLVALAMGHGALLLLAPPLWFIALGVWWNANTISHNFIHLPFFRSRSLNILFSAYLSVVLGFPQSLWRARHLAHHRGVSPSWIRLKSGSWLEGALVLCLWLILLGTRPEFFATAYLPGWLAGLALCRLQGYFEHARGATSHYSRLYNWLFFNDGFHVEHHAMPAQHWTQLPRSKAATNAANSSPWPAVLRWLEWISLDGLERLVLRSTRMQAFVLQRHESAFRRLLPLLSPPRRVTIVGGGLFPRTALVLRRITPEAELRIVDARPGHLDEARALLDGSVDLTCGFYEAALAGNLIDQSDLVVIPLAFMGDKSAIYRSPPARQLLVHDWLWRKRGRSVVISILLLKRLNLVQA
jgi:hypothetical protein